MMKTAAWIGNALGAAGFVAVASVATSAGSQAQTPAEFFKGKTIELDIGYSTGGGYDVYGRLLARFIGKHIPGNPNVVPKNMEGAGSLRAANWLYNGAPKDGTAFGTIGRGTAFDPILVKAPAQFDATKFGWIGSMNDEVSVCVSWKDSGITSFDQLYTQELVIGGTGASADTDQFPRMLNSVLATKFKIVTGYPGGNDVNLAMERGEVKGRCGWSWSSVKSTQPGWLKNKTINVLLQMSLSKHPDMPDVPLVVDLAKTEEQRQIFKLVFARQVMGRPFLAPPNLPADRLAALRTAFDETMKDPAMLAEAEKADLEITPVSGAKLQTLLAEIYAQPKAVAELAAKALE
jgi:tripartite-type tricarboxylate transporter receptor subunit TctC